MLLIALYMHGESPTYKEYEFDSQGVHSIIDACIARQYIGMMLMRDENPVGFFVGYVKSMEFVNLVSAYEMFWYVRPNHRNIRNAKKLLRSFTDAAKRQGAKRIFLSTTSGINPGRTAKFYEGIGYKLVGVAASKEI